MLEIRSWANTIAEGVEVINTITGELFEYCEESPLDACRHASKAYGNGNQFVWFGPESVRCGNFAALAAA